MGGVLGQAREAVNRNAWALLTIGTALWGGNVAAGRLAVDQVSPMSMVTLRWALASALLWLFARAEARAAWPRLAPRWRRIVWMGALGFTGFNALFYVGARYTSGVNIAIIQGVTPIFVMAGAAAIFGQRFRALHWIGLALTILGACVIAARGDPAELAALQINYGDVLMFVACILFAGYSLGLRDRPDVAPIAFFAAMAMVACLTSLPLLAIEIAMGHFFRPSLLGVALVVYVGVGPSFLAQIFYIRGVTLIGPARAGVYYNLVPIWGALFSVALLGEPFRAFHAVALALVLGGIWLAERAR
ncbi:MAG: DMT family transporter [Methylobacteriaceae bacterium]|nr:DMT family transporter [Methylobacteriaceae bacterium]